MQKVQKRGLLVSASSIGCSALPMFSHKNKKQKQISSSLYSRPQANNHSPKRTIQTATVVPNLVPPTLRWQSRPEANQTTPPAMRPTHAPQLQAKAHPAVGGEHGVRRATLRRRQEEARLTAPVLETPFLPARGAAKV